MLEAAKQYALSSRTNKAMMKQDKRYSSKESS